jgi:xylan 1,4-beta-xylosidase
MLHGLGTERYDVDSEHALVTRQTDGSFEIALWNYAPPGGTGAPITLSLQLRDVAARSARVQRLDAENGDVSGAYRRMGSPTYPTPMQLKQLIKASTLPAPQELPIVHDRLSITVPAHGLAMVEVAAGPR